MIPTQKIINKPNKHFAEGKGNLTDRNVQNKAKEKRINVRIKTMRQPKLGAVSVRTAVNDAAGPALPISAPRQVTYPSHPVLQAPQPASNS
jgi:hypothetical protein